MLANIYINTSGELQEVVHIIEASPLYKAALAELSLPAHLDPVIEPWPYGTLESDDEPGRYFQGLVYAQDNRSGDPDTNFYAFPVPMIPVVDYYKREVARVIKLATGGVGERWMRRHILRIHWIIARLRNMSQNCCLVGCGKI